MPVKTFRASTLNAALAAVQADLGPHAVILHTKTHKAGGILGLGRQTIHEITATAPAAPAPTSQPSRNPAQHSTSTTHRPSQRDHNQEDHDDRRRRLLALAAQHAAANRTKHQLNTPPTTSTPSTDRPVNTSASPSAPTAYTRPTPSPQPTPAASDAPRPAPAPDYALTERIDALSSMVSTLLHTHRAPDAAGLPEPLARALTTLLDNDAPEPEARAIIDAAAKSLATADTPDDTTTTAAVTAAIAARLTAQTGIPKPGPQPDNRPLTIALVGPTGVGKTTTIAKLAATYKLRFGARVALITCDTYRIAAVDQLRTYANIIGIPVRVAVTPADLRHALDDLQDHADVVIVDTAGRSHHDTNQIQELAEGLEHLNPHQTHLVLSLSHAPRVLTAAAHTFVAANPTHLTLTKLDEAASIGPVLSILTTLAARGAKPALAYVTTGQQVPDQIDLANPHALAARMLKPAHTSAPNAHTAQPTRSQSSNDEPPQPIRITQEPALNGTA